MWVAPGDEKGPKVQFTREAQHETDFKLLTTLAGPCCQAYTGPPPSSSLFPVGPPPGTALPGPASSAPPSALKMDGGQPWPPLLTRGPTEPCGKNGEVTMGPGSHCVHHVLTSITAGHTR